MPAVPRSLFLPGETSSQFSAQWRNPSDVFSVLLILGGDIIQQALAQLSGSYITPIAFSFGWVAYGVSAISSAIGENKLMPMADCSCKVINGKSGYVRDNVSWIIGRIVRDFEQWGIAAQKDKTIMRKVEYLLDERWRLEKEKWKARTGGHEEGNEDPEPVRPTQTGLCVSVYKAGKPLMGTPGYDLLYWVGLATIVIQLGIASIPFGLYGDYGQLLVTSIGTMLALLTGCLAQWKKEKWESRKCSKQNFVLTRGNGSQHAIVILGDGKGLNLEDLSAVPTNVDVWTSKTTQLATIILGTLWVCLLISASGLQEHTWYLMAVGAIGIVENIFVAGRWRNPEAFGIPLHFQEVLGEIKVMDALFAVEERYPYIGRSMRDTYFPGELFPAESTRWDDLKNTAKQRKKNLEEEQNDKHVDKYMIQV